jgi:hypothetical protein
MYRYNKIVFLPVRKIYGNPRLKSSNWPHNFEDILITKLANYSHEIFLLYTKDIIIPSQKTMLQSSETVV